MLTLWHGAHRWDGPPRLIASKKGHAEHGVGIYCTTSLTTASKYAKGGGHLRQMTISPELHLLEKHACTCDELIALVKNCEERFPKRAQLVDELSRHEGRVIHAGYLINLMSSLEILYGNHGKEISEQLSQLGINASIYSRYSEDWLIILDPSIIVTSQKMSVNDVSIEQWELPSIEKQLQSYRPSSSMECTA